MARVKILIFTVFTYTCVCEDVGGVIEQALLGDFKDICSVYKHAQTRTEGKKQVTCQGKDGVKLGAVPPGFRKELNLKNLILPRIRNNDKIDLILFYF